MLSISIAVIIWAILGCGYAVIRDLKKFDILILTWMIIGCAIVFYVCGKGTGMF